MRNILVALAALITPILPSTKCDDDRIHIETIEPSERAYVYHNDKEDTVTLFIPRGLQGESGQDGQDGPPGKDATVEDFLNSPRISSLEAQVEELTKTVYDYQKEVKDLWETPVTIAFRIESGEIKERKYTLRELRTKRFTLQLSLKE
tara:strand:- start:246 stop:689 length:444 start_codon:yes stop_codon:yes gene_type:complete